MFVPGYKHACSASNVIILTWDLWDNLSAHKGEVAFKERIFLLLRESETTIYILGPTCYLKTL